MDNKKEKISNLELLEAMSGINEKYLKEADSLCIKKKNYWHMAVAVYCGVIGANIKEILELTLENIRFDNTDMQKITIR